MEPEYDWETCVTAAELRSCGYKVPDDIPDVAWVPNSSVRVTLNPSTLNAESGAIHFDSEMTFLVPFRWLQVEVRLPIAPIAVITEINQ